MLKFTKYVPGERRMGGRRRDVSTQRRDYNYLQPGLHNRVIRHNQTAWDVIIDVDEKGKHATLKLPNGKVLGKVGTTYIHDLIRAARCIGSIQRQIEKLSENFLEINPEILQPSKDLLQK